MKYKIVLAFIFLSFFLKAGFSQDCNNMPSHFSSYEGAILWVKKATFKFKDEANTSKSSWIRSASYYSCDGKAGYFIFLTDSKEYIHKDVPIEIWREFKNASSFGSYYDHNLKHKYRFYL